MKVWNHTKARCKGRCMLDKLSHSTPDHKLHENGEYTVFLYYISSTYNTESTQLVLVKWMKNGENVQPSYAISFKTILSSIPCPFILTSSTLDGNQNCLPE